MSADGWLVLQDIILHSGRHSDFKFECDKLTDDEIEAFGLLMRRMVAVLFSEVCGIARGGLRIARTLEPFRVALPQRRLLIVDDVLTESTSMECARVDAIRKGWRISDICGAVMISRGECPKWIAPVLQLHPRLCS